MPLIPGLYQEPDSIKRKRQARGFEVMSWARIMAPLCGGPGDAAVLEAAAVLAAPFGAEVAGVYAPPDVAELTPWMGEGLMGGVQAVTMESVTEAAAQGEAAARSACGDRFSFTALPSPVWSSLAAESRLADVVVFDAESARGRGPLAEGFRQLVAGEQRPVVVAREGLRPDGVVAVAWDGGKEASRAARTALPLLLHAGRVVILTAACGSGRYCRPERLQAFYAARGLAADVESLNGQGDAANLLLDAARALGARLLVAGAFGHPRLREFIFGGATRTFLTAAQPSLFLSH
jgi:nucleotide-binding universal stress UspA family protein